MTELWLCTCSKHANSQLCIVPTAQCLINNHNLNVLLHMLSRVFCPKQAKIPNFDEIYRTYALAYKERVLKKTIAEI